MSTKNFRECERHQLQTQVRAAEDMTLCKKLFFHGFLQSQSDLREAWISSGKGKLTVAALPADLPVQSFFIETSL